MNQTLLRDAGVWLAAFDGNDDHQDEAPEAAWVHPLRHCVYDAAYVAAHQARSEEGWRLVSRDGHLTEPKFAETPADVLDDKAPGI